MSIRFWTGQEPPSFGFELDGREFMALNGVPKHGFSDALSLLVSCDTQAEIDAIWARLSGRPA